MSLIDEQLYILGTDEHSATEEVPVDDIEARLAEVRHRLEELEGSIILGGSVSLETLEFDAHSHGYTHDTFARLGDLGLRHS